MNILDVGCGNNKYQGSIGVDLYLDTQADVICDLKNYIYPFRNDIFDLTKGINYFMNTKEEDE